MCTTECCSLMCHLISRVRSWKNVVINLNYLKLITALIIILKKFRHFQKYSQLCFVINTGPDHSFHFFLIFHQEKTRLYQVICSWQVQLVTKSFQLLVSSQIRWNYEIALHDCFELRVKSVYDLFHFRWLKLTLSI